MATAPSSACVSTLDDLEAFAKSEAGSGPAQTIDLTTLPIPGLATFVRRTMGSAVHLTSATVTSEAEGVLLTGVIEAFGTTFTTTVDCARSGGALTAEVKCVQSTTGLNLAALVSQVTQRPAPKVPSIMVSNLQLSFGSDKSDFLFTGSGSWQVPLGEASPAVTAVLNLSSTGAVITGTLALGQTAFDVELDLAKGANTLIGTWTHVTQPIGWDQVVKAAGLSPSLDLPRHAPNPQFNQLQLTLALSDGSASFTGLTSQGATAFLLVKKASSGWGFAFGVDQPGVARLSEISSDLSLFDFVGFTDAYLMFSSYADPEFALPSGSTSTIAPIAVAPGVNLGAQLAIGNGTGRLAQNLGKLLGGSTGSLACNLSASPSLTASLSGFSLPQKSLTMSSPQLTVSESGGIVDVSLSGAIAMTIGGELVVVTGSFDINEVEARFKIHAALQNPPLTLHAPFGFNGVTLDGVGGEIEVVFETCGIALGLDVEFSLGNTTAQDQFAFGLEAGPEYVNPLYLKGTIDQSITLPLLINTLVPEIKVPSILNSFSVFDLNVLWCDTPGQQLSDGTPVPVGFYFGGGLTAFNFSLEIQMNLTSSHTTGASHSSLPEASGLISMSAININNVVMISGVTTPGPQFAFSTSPAAGDVLASGSIKVIVAGASGQMSGQLKSNGEFSFGLSVKVDNDLATLTCTLQDHTHFSANTVLIFGLKMDVDLNQIPGVHLGTLHVNAQFSGTITLSVSPEGASLKLAGSFDGRSFSVQVGLTGSTLSNAADLVRDQIQKEAKTIFSDLLSDPKKWADLTAKGLATGAGDVKSGVDTGVNTVKTGVNTGVNTVKSGVDTGINTLKHLL